MFYLTASSNHSTQGRRSVVSTGRGDHPFRDVYKSRDAFNDLMTGVSQMDPERLRSEVSQTHDGVRMAVRSEEGRIARHLYFVATFKPEGTSRRHLTMPHVVSTPARAEVIAHEFRKCMGTSSEAELPTEYIDAIRRENFSRMHLLSLFRECKLLPTYHLYLRWCVYNSILLTKDVGWWFQTFFHSIWDNPNPIGVHIFQNG